MGVPSPPPLVPPLSPRHLSARMSWSVEAGADRVVVPVVEDAGGCEDGGGGGGVSSRRVTPQRIRVRYLHEEPALRAEALQFLLAMIADSERHLAPWRRRLFHAIYSTKYLDTVVLVLILTNCVFLAIIDPADPDAKVNDVARQAEYVFTACFTLELILRICSQGFVLPKTAYLRDPWNVLDFCIVVSGIVMFCLEVGGFSGTSALFGVRAVRLLKPLKAVTKVKEVQIVVSSLLSSLPQLMDVVLLYIFFVLIMSIVGTHLFSGKLRATCVPDPAKMLPFASVYYENQTVWHLRTTGEVLPRQAIYAVSGMVFPPATQRAQASQVCSSDIHNESSSLSWHLGGKACPWAYVCEATENPFNDKVSFDNIFKSLLTCFTLITLEGWGDVMVLTVAATHNLVWLFYLAVIMFGAFFIINLSLVIINDEFCSNVQRIRDSDLGYHIKPDAQKLPAFPRLAEQLSNLPLAQRLLRMKASAREMAFCVVSHRWFQAGMNAVVLTNCLMLAVQHKGQPEGMRDGILVAGYVFTGVYGLEAALKMAAYPPREYFRDLHNVLELVIVVTSVVVLVVWRSSHRAAVLNSLRLFRLFQLAKHFPEHWMFFSSVGRSVRGVAVLTCVLLLVILIYALMGMALFGGKLCGLRDVEYATGPLGACPGLPRENFDTLAASLITVFTVVSSEKWNETMYHAMRGTTDWACFYFISLVVIGNYVVINLFIAVLLDGMEQSADAYVDRWGCTLNDSALARSRARSRVSVAHLIHDAALAPHPNDVAATAAAATAARSTSMPGGSGGGGGGGDDDGSGGGCTPPLAPLSQGHSLSLTESHQLFFTPQNESVAPTGGVGGDGEPGAGAGAKRGTVGLTMTKAGQTMQVTAMAGQEEHSILASCSPTRASLRLLRKYASTKSGAAGGGGGATASGAAAGAAPSPPPPQATSPRAREAEMRSKFREEVRRVEALLESSVASPASTVGTCSPPASERASSSQRSPKLSFSSRSGRSSRSSRLSTSDSIRSADAPSKRASKVQRGRPSRFQCGGGGGGSESISASVDAIFAGQGGGSPRLLTPMLGLFEAGSGGGGGGGGSGGHSLSFSQGSGGAEVMGESGEARNGGGGGATVPRDEPAVPVPMTTPSLALPSFERKEESEPSPVARLGNEVSFQCSLNNLMRGATTQWADASPGSGGGCASATSGSPRSAVGRDVSVYVFPTEGIGRSAAAAVGGGAVTTMLSWEGAKGKPGILLDNVEASKKDAGADAGGGGEEAGVFRRVRREWTALLDWCDRDTTALFLMAEDNLVRRRLRLLVESIYFEMVVIAFICVSTVALAVEKPLAPPDTLHATALRYVGYSLTGVFIVEALLRILAYGFVLHRASYLRADGWNVLDFVIVVTSVAELIVQTNNEARPGVLGVMRIARALRPLRFINRSKGLKTVVDSLVGSVKGLSHVLLITSMIFVVFAIIGMQLLTGTFHACTFKQWGDVSRGLVCPHESEPLMERLRAGADACSLVAAHEEASTGVFEGIGEGDCGPPYLTTEAACVQYAPMYRWEVYESHFDHIGYALLTLFQVSSLDAWVDIMWVGTDSSGVDGVAPSLNARGYVAIYFIVITVVASFFLVNLFVGVLLAEYEQAVASSEEATSAFATLTNVQQEWKNTQDLIVNNIKPVFLGGKSLDPRQARVHRVVTSRRFDTAISLCIALNVLTMSMEALAAELDEPLFYVSVVFVAIFSVEAALKIFAMGPRGYFQDRSNRFDFFVVVVSLISVSTARASSQTLPAFISVLRVFRFVKLFRVARMTKGVRVLLRTLALSLPALVNVAALLALMFSMYGILGVHFFGKLARGRRLNEHRNFDHFFNAIILLFELMTGEGWHQAMTETTHEECPYCDPQLGTCGWPMLSYFYFLTFIVIAMYVMLNLVVAIILKEFSAVREEELSVVSVDEVLDFSYEWDRIDPARTGMISTARLEHLMQKVAPPLGAGKGGKGRRTPFLKALGLSWYLQNHSGDVYAREVLLEAACAALCEAYGVDRAAVALPAPTQAIQDKKLQVVFPVVQPCSTVDAAEVATLLSAYKLQRYYRGHSVRKAVTMKQAAMRLEIYDDEYTDTASDATTTPSPRPRQPSPLFPLAVPPPHPPPKPPPPAEHFARFESQKRQLARSIRDCEGAPAGSKGDPSVLALPRSPSARRRSSALSRGTSQQGPDPGLRARAGSWQKRRASEH